MKKILVILLACAAFARAETKIWLGGDGNFTTPELWSGSAVPAVGDEVVISNGAVTVTSSDTFTGLVSIALGPSGAIVCSETVETEAAVTFSSSNTLQVSAGELVFHGYASGTGFTKEGAGNVRFTGRNSSLAALLPGLREMPLAGSFNLTASNTGTRVSAALQMANSVWPNTDTTFAYTGEIYLDGSVYAFAENMDDNVYLSIGGTTVLSNTVSNAVSSNTLQLAAGWYPIDLRVGNASGNGGSLNVFSTGGGVAWKKGILPWQILRDYSGGTFLRSPGKLAASFSEGVVLNGGSVVVCTETAADAVNSDELNNLGGLALNAGALVLSNAVCRATALDGVSNALLRLDFTRLTLTNETDCAYLGKTAGVGTLEKDGAGRLQWEARSSTHYAHAATVVNDGTIALGNSATWLGDYNFGTFTVNAPGAVETLINGNSQFSSLWGDGTMTNTSSSGGPWQLRITAGPCEFGGQINGNIRYYSQGAVALTGTNSAFTGNFAIHSSGGPGITGVKKIGTAGQPSSIGSGGQIDIRENGGTFQYLGTGETTSKSFLLYPSANRAVIDGGPYGGVTFNGTWTGSGGRLCRVVVTGTNATPCVLNGAYAENTQSGTNYSTYLAKEGPNTWIFKHHASRSNRGVVDVREGTLQFESIAEAGQVCSLGRSDLLFADVINSVTNGLGVPYAFSLGTASTVGTLEYIGTNTGFCSTRKLVLQGDGRLKSDAAPLSFLGGVEALSAGSKTLTLDGSATNMIGFISDGAGTVGLTKEGSGTWLLSTTNTFSGPLEVKAGRLILDKRGYSYYRFNLLQRNYGVPGGDTNIELDEFALYDAGGVRQNLNLVKNGTNNVAALNPGEFCPMGNYPTYAGRNDINLFDASLNSQWTVNTTGFLPNTPLSLVMRLTNGAPAITSYDLQYWYFSSSNRFLSGWSVDGSRDGTSWDTLDTVTNFVPVPPAVVAVGSVNWWYSTGTVTPSNGFAIADGQLTNAQLQAGVQVSVAAGAELSLLGGAEPLSALSVDCDAGGGTISDLYLAPTGQFELTGTSIQGLNFTVPLTIGTFVNPELLPNWDIIINGELIQGAVLRWDASTGTLRVAPLGTLIMVK
jgi:autotransporter-associated beta strand protein